MPEYDDFLANVDSDFTAEIDGATVIFHLVEVSPIPRSAGTPREQPFSLEFQGPSEPVLPQRIYVLNHEVLGRFEIFLVPLGPARQTGLIRYEAIFN